MKKLILLSFLFVSIVSSSQTCNLLNHSCNNTTGLYTSGITANAGSTLACTTGNYVLYSSSSGNPYIATDDLLINQGNAATLHFTAKKNSTYTGTAEIWVHVGGYCNFNVYTTPFNTNGWVMIGTFNPTTTCSSYGPFTVPSDVIGGNLISYCIVLKNASSTNWVSIDDICVSQIAGSAVPTTYTETFGTSSTGWYPSAGYIGVPYHTYKNASDAYVILGTGQGGGIDKAAYFYTGFDFCSTVSGTGIVTKEINTAGYTNGEVRISFKSRYPCSGTLSYTFDEDYTSYSPEVFIMEGPDDGSNSWIPLPVNYYFADYTWRVASYDISAYKNSNIRIKVERGGFCGTAMEAVDNIKVLDRNCAISLLSCGTITGETSPLASTDYSYTVPAVAGATYYKWFVRSEGNLYDASPYIVSGQGTQNVTINFGSLPSTGLRVLCIPYDANPAVVADACYAEIGYLGVTISTSTPLTVDAVLSENSSCFGANDGEISLTVSGGAPGYTYSWIPNVSTTNSATNLAPGSYQITVTDQDLNQVVQTVLITEPSEIVISGLSDQIICYGDAYFGSALTTSGGSGTHSYSWSPSYNISNTSILNPYFYPTTATTYTLIVTDGNGCIETGQFEIDINQPPTAAFSTNISSGCPPLSVDFSNLTMGSAFCHLNFGDGNYFDGCADVNNVYQNSGVYDIVLTVIDADGCADTLFCNNCIEVFDEPIFDLGGPYTICDGQNQLLDAGTGFAAYDWSTAETSQTISVNLANTYSVTVTNLNGCQNSDAVEIIVSTPPLVDLGNDQTICSGDNLILDAGSDLTNDYLWSTSETTNTISVSGSGTYSVTVTNPELCVATDEIEIFLAPNPAIDLGGPYTICDGDSILLDAGSGFSIYSWSTTESTSQIYASASGVYMVTVTDINNCSSSDDASVNTVEPPSIFLGSDIVTCDNIVMLDAGAGYDSYLWSTTETSQSINANASGTYWVEITSGPCTNADTIAVTIRDCSGIAEADYDGILVYPNPMTDFLSIQNLPADSEIVLYDINGKELIRDRSQNSSYNLNTEDFVRGTYLLVIKSDSKIYHWKLVK
jgi:hypothetical protein